MFSYDFSDVLRKKLEKIGKKDNVLAGNFYKKVQEIIHREEYNKYSEAVQHAYDLTNDFSAVIEKAKEKSKLEGFP